MQAGWDWASETHDVTVMDDAGQVVDHWSLIHDEAGLDRAIRRLANHGHPDELPVAIETTNGVVVERLVAAGHPVVPVHPNAFNATRARWGAARAKSDPGDSWKLADLLRTDGHRLHRLRPLDAATRHLQALARLRDDHLAAKTAATMKLGALLDAHWPGAKAIFARLDSPIALAFLERYPTPQVAQRLGEARLAAFLQRHSYSGHRSPAALLARLRAAPVAVNSLDPKVLAACVGTQVQLLGALLAAIAGLDRALRTALGSIPRPPCWRPCRASARSTWPTSWPRSAPSWTGPTTPNTPPPRPALAQSPNSPARPPRSTSAGRPTPAPATPWPPSPTTAATPPPGPPPCTARPAAAASAIPRPSGS